MENENLFVGSDSAVKVVGRLRNSRLGWTVTGTRSSRGGDGEQYVTLIVWIVSVSRCTGMLKAHTIGI